MPIDESGWAKVRFRAAGTSNAVNEGFTAGALAIDLTPSFAENIVPGSINFTLGGKTYFDRLGSLYYDLNPVTGAATLAGNINYANGAAEASRRGCLPHRTSWACDHCSPRWTARRWTN